MLEGAEPAQPAHGTVVDAEQAAQPVPCPACGHMMTAMQLAEVIFDRCGQCGGLWLDADEELPEGPHGALSAAGGLLLYALSLPERTVRTTVGLAGGVVTEVTDRLVPQAFQNSSTYTVLVRNSMRFLVHDVGGVARAQQQEEEDPAIENFVARKAVGNFLELAGLATLHLSPLLVLAVVSDVAYGSKAYLAELADELRREGIIEADSTIGTVDDLMESVGTATGTAARLFDTPPFSIDDLRGSTAAIREAVASIDPRHALPQAEIRRLWNEMRDVAERDHVGLMQVSSAMTLHALGKITHVGRGTFRGIHLAGSLVNRHILGHYGRALADIHEKGFYATVNETAAPYVEAVWNNFSTGKESVTEHLLSGRLVSRWFRRLGGLFRPRAKEESRAAPQ